MPTFVLNDENVINCYGFRVRNAGIDFSVFDTNPVMLADHINETDFVRGNWKNRRIDGSKLLMDTNFDLDLPDAKTLSGQVERGFVKGASAGYSVDFDDFERQPDGNWDLVQCTMVEGSICAVPGNSAALVLYNKATGELMKEGEIKLAMVKLSAANKVDLTKPNRMEKITLSAGANSVLLGLGVADNGDAMQISSALVKLHADYEKANKDLKELQEQRKAELKANAEAMVDGAILDEKILAGDRQDWIDLAMANYSLAVKQVAKLKGKTTLNANNQQANPTDPKTIDEFEKMSEEAKLSFKTNSPDKYKLLFK